MKYLKRFNESLEEVREQLSEELKTIEDSLLDLVDIGCAVNVTAFEVKAIGRPGISIKFGYYNDPSINTVKLLPISIGEHLLAIDSYLKERGFVGYDPYTYDNPYSPSRHKVKVNAHLKGIKNEFENELSEFVKMLDRFKVNAPFDSVGVNYYKPEPYVNESLSFKDPEGKWILVNDLKEMSLELTDMGFYVEVFKEGTISSSKGDIRVIITKNKNFNMDIDLRDFLFRSINYMEEKGYHFDINSNHGRLYFVTDGRIILSSGEVRENYPSFTMVNILFKK